MRARPLSIAVDGPGSSGKGTVARLVAQELGYAYVDTGAMYRCVGLACLQAGVDPGDDAACGVVARGADIRFEPRGETQGVLLDGRDVTKEIRRPEVGMAASDVATLPAVRQALLQQQRLLGDQGGVVMDGRDIGTVVLPEAELKVYLDATLETRAARRFLELQQRGSEVSAEEVAQELRRRDRQDTEREVAPLVQAPDAVRLDTTELSAEAAAAEVVRLARSRGA